MDALEAKTLARLLDSRRLWLILHQNAEKFLVRSDDQGGLGDVRGSAHNTEHTREGGGKTGSMLGASLNAPGARKGEG